MLVLGPVQWLTGGDVIVCVCTYAHVHAHVCAWWGMAGERRTSEVNQKYFERKFIPTELKYDNMVENYWVII